MATGITFATNSLQNSAGGITVENIRHFGGPRKQVNVYPLANANRSKAGNSNWPDKTIVVTGNLKASSISALDTLIDTFKGYFIDGEQNLDIDYAGGTRRYKAIVSEEPDIQRERGITIATFTVVFLCTQPFGESTSSTSALSASARTSHSYDDAHSFVGNAPFQLPVVTITINSITGGDSFLNFSNDANGQGITIIDRTFAASDVVVIDSKLREVRLNGTPIDYLGSFPEFPGGSQTMHYEDGFTAVNFDIDVDYYPLWK